MEAFACQIKKDGKVLVEAPIVIYGDNPQDSLNEAIVAIERTMRNDAGGAIITIDPLDLLRSLMRQSEHMTVERFFALVVDYKTPEAVNA